VLLDALRVPGRRVLGRAVPRSYTECLDRGALRGARLAYDLRYVTGDLGPGSDETLAVIDGVLDTLRHRGAHIEEVESASPLDPDSNGRIPWDDEFTMLLFEFKVQIAEYLAPLRHTRIRTLADLIEFNTRHCAEELVWFGQELFEAAEATSGDLTDPEYLAARAANVGFGRSVMDGILQQGFDAIITPSFSYGNSPAAVCGYPSMSVPVGYTPTGHPVGLWLTAGFMQEPRMIRLGAAIEQAVDARVAPRLEGSVPPDPTPFPGCAATAASATAATAFPQVQGTGAEQPTTSQRHRHHRHW
jgi:amidase